MQTQWEQSRSCPKEFIKESRMRVTVKATRNLQSLEPWNSWACSKNVQLLHLYCWPWAAVVDGAHQVGRGHTCLRTRGGQQAGLLSLKKKKRQQQHEKYEIKLKKGGEEDSRTEGVPSREGLARQLPAGGHRASWSQPQHPTAPQDVTPCLLSSQSDGSSAELQESSALQLRNEQLPSLLFLGSEYLFSSSPTSKGQILIIWIGRARYGEAMGGSGAAPSDVTPAAWPSLHPDRAAQESTANYSARSSARWQIDSR